MGRRLDKSLLRLACRSVGSLVRDEVLKGCVTAPAQPNATDDVDMSCIRPTFTTALFFSYKNHVYENVEAQITLKFKNIVVISLVAIYISF